MNTFSQEMLAEEYESHHSRNKEESKSFESRLTIGQVLDLQAHFSVESIGPSDVVEGLDQNAFVGAFRKVFKTNDYDEQSICLFNNISKQPRNGEDVSRVTWGSFLDHLIEHQRDSHESRLFRAFPSLNLDHNYFLLTHNRRQCTARVITIMASSLIYIFVSKHGVVGILDRHLTLENKYSVDLDDINHRESSSNKPKRITQAWVTDAIHMGDCKKLVVGSTKRTLHFLDISAATHMEEFRLFGLTNSATCFAYWFDANDESKGSLLFFGDDAGHIHQVHFRRPRTLLFKKDTAEGLVRIFVANLEEHHDYVIQKKMDIDHNGDAVTRIQYIRHNQCIISCADGESSPVIISDVHGKLQRYVFRTNKGIKCFDFNRSLNLLVTGGQDCLVCLWNPYVTSRPTASLKSHQATVIDTKILRDTSTVISYSTDMVIMIWDVVEELCLQKLHLHFPLAKRKLSADTDWEHGYYPLHLDTFKSKSILVTCKDYVTELSLKTTVTNKWRLTTATESPRSTDNTAKGHATNLKTRERFPTILKTYSAQTHKTIEEPTNKANLKTCTGTMPTYPKLKECAQAMEEFKNYIYNKLNQFDGHPSRDEIEIKVLKGMPSRVLKVQHPLQLSSIEELMATEHSSHNQNSTHSKLVVASPDMFSQANCIVPPQRIGLHLPSPSSYNPSSI